MCVRSASVNKYTHDMHAWVYSPDFCSFWARCNFRNQNQHHFMPDFVIILTAFKSTWYQEDKQINIIQYDNYFQYQIANSMIIFKAFLNLPSFFIVLASALSPIYVLFLNYCIMWWSGVIWYSLFGIRVRALI